MKRITLSLLTLSFAVFTAPAMAADLMVASAMQHCASNEDCALVTNSCSDNCGFVPINKTNLPTLQQLYQTRCNKPMDANPTCNMNPPIAAACINSRCTIDYAYANNAGPKDYQAGAYPTPEAAVPNQVQGDYSHVNDRKDGFTAYNLPQGAVKQNTVGQVTTTIYVPPSAPVSGGAYVPVGSAPPAPAIVPTAPAPTYAPAPAMAAPANIPAVAMPTAQSYATPAVVTPAPTPAPTPVPPATSYIAPPPMTPSTPNQVQGYVPAPAVPATPMAAAPAPAPYEYVAPEAPMAPATAPAIPSVGATGVPVAPANAIPIPPSDMKPAPTFVPPTGSAIPVAPEDPGAPPPPGTNIIMKKGPDGSPGLTISDPNAKKTFGSKTVTTKKTTTYDTNQ